MSDRPNPRVHLREIATVYVDPNNGRYYSAKTKSPRVKYTIKYQVRWKVGARTKSAIFPTKAGARNLHDRLRKAMNVDERFDLEQYLRPHHDDPGGHLTAWARQFIRTDGLTGTRDLLVKMNEFIRVNFRYAERDEEGTQTPQATLKLNSGSCRDFALLMMEAARRLGIATRFVSGYLYDPALDGGKDAGTVGAGSTHAWLQAYLPGAGWVPFDPTNNLLGGNQLIRVGVARDPSQAAPIAGSWYGEPGDYLGMTVNVVVKRR